MRLMPEFKALDRAKSMMRDLPPKNTAGLARRSVSSMRRLPRPPARTKAMAERERLPKPLSSRVIDWSSQQHHARDVRHVEENHQPAKGNLPRLARGNRKGGLGSPHLSCARQDLRHGEAWRWSGLGLAEGAGGVSAHDRRRRPRNLLRAPLCRP